MPEETNQVVLKCSRCGEEKYLDPQTIQLEYSYQVCNCPRYFKFEKEVRPSQRFTV